MDEKIVLIVGPSGVGKDTLLKAVKKEFEDKVNFVRRYISRMPDKNEDNFFIEASAFSILQTNNFFISSWLAHGNSYGISKTAIKKGVNIISISRSKIKDFETSFENVFTINITVSKEVLRMRLENRARESEEEIEKRLNRTYEKIEARNLIEFDNSLSKEESTVKFISLIEEIIDA